VLTNRQNYYWRLIMMRSEDEVYAVKDTVIIKEGAYLIEEVDNCGDSGFQRFLNHLHYLLCLQREGGGVSNS
jgi:hypothetical protein